MVSARNASLATGSPKTTTPTAAVRHERKWTFLTNHAHVLVCLSTEQSLTARELSLRVGITERAVQAVLSDLVEDGYLIKTKVGRRNHYKINPKGRLRHPLEASRTVGELLSALT